MAAQGMHQSQNLSLQQVLAPQLQQSLLILQAPLLELRNLVQQEMETNPVLEELATDPDSPSTTESAASDQEFKEEFDKLAKLDEEWRDYMAQSGSYSARAHEDEEKRQFFFDSIATTETLQQHLMSQLNQQVLNANDRKTAELIIGNIDDNGFLQTTPDEPPRPTFLELLFDLVFVFAFGRVSDQLVAGLNSPPPTIDEFGKALLLLLALLMVWFATAWLIWTWSRIV